MGSKAKRNVQLYLDKHMEDFRNQQVEFVADLASLLKIGIEQMEDIYIRSGCVKFTVLLPAEIADALEQALKLDPIPLEIQNFFDKYDIKVEKTGFDVIATAPNLLSTDQISKELSASGRVLTWLHISDAHFLVDDHQSAAWSQNIVKREFIDKLPSMLGGWNLQPDFVFFTGDVAYSGKKEEYNNALGFLNDLKANLPQDTLFYIVPGNHDVTWECITVEEDVSIDKQLNAMNKVNSFLLNDDYEEIRKKSFGRFDNYKEFIEMATASLGHIPFNEDYYYWDEIERSEVKVFVAGLNSAWRSTRKDTHPIQREPDLNNLILGEPQLIKTSQKMDGSHITFALMHHPPETLWFREFDKQMQASLLPRFDFVLRGHEHQTEVTRISNINSDNEYIEIAAGALYDPSELKGIAGYPICFNAVRLNVETGKGMIFYWRYFPQGYRWVRDILTDNGCKIFNLPNSLLNRLNCDSISSNLGRHATQR